MINIIYDEKKITKCIECILIVSEKYTKTWCRYSTENCKDPYKEKNKKCAYE